jgi:glutathione peroxidase
MYTGMSCFLSGHGRKLADAPANRDCVLYQRSHYARHFRRKGGDAFVQLFRLLIFSLLGALGLGRPRTGGAVGETVDWGAVRLPANRGGLLPTAGYAGQVVLLVNTASRCGFTKQYAALEALWRRHRAQGLVVLGVPSNDFGAQEPGSDAEIARFCATTFDVTFPLAARQAVSGTAAHPLYLWAAEQTGAIGAPNWNFHKILIGRDGRVVDWFSAVGGAGDKLERAVRRALGA